MWGRHCCFCLFITIYISCTLINVFCDESASVEGLNDVKASTVTVSDLTNESLRKLTERSDEHLFSAEVPKMMKLIINSVYSNKEIFLRELVSNAADAVENIRFQSITNADVLSSLSDLSIMIKTNQHEKTISIRDTGIGMTRDELVKNLGTIAKSGTSELLSKLSEGNSSAPTDLIGQFGVGFYSAFLVADRVTVISKHNDDDQYVWESDSTSFKIAKDPRGNTLGRGTEVILHVKDEAKEYLQQDVLRKILKKYSQFVMCPIKLWESRTVNVEEDVEEEKVDLSDDISVEEEKPKSKKTVEKTVWDWVQLNDLKPIWTKKPSEVAEESYKELFKVLSRSSESPLAHIHFSAEGEVSFNAILFISPVPRPDLFQSDKLITDNIKLYVRKVFITENVDEMLPRYLSFVYGIVDSDNLPLNVSREMLQQHKLLKLIKKKLVRKVIEMLQKMSDEDYEKFWKAYSVAIKLGVLQDAPNKARLTELLRFYTSKSEDKLTSFSNYISRMKEGQEHIFYVAGQNIDEVKTSLFVERIKRLGFEVIYFTEPMDEYVMQSLHEVMGKKTQNLAKAGLDLKLDKEKFEEQEKLFRPLTDWLKDKGLSGKIKDAKISQRLESSPCALVADEYMVSGNFQKVILAQAYATSDSATNSYYLNQKHTLEINPRHPLIKKLNELVQIDPDDEVAKENTLLLFDTAVLRSGYIMQDLSGFAERIERELRKNLDVDPDEQVEPDESIPSETDSANVTEMESADVKEEL
ncbi:Endoplasmin [Echinococcus granulosus]|uniref:Endoplasmin n=1 Tax=Echinococcus granulosus TaxID=6210 RepID=U6J2Y9_ECHGR|nr:Endoplasmin [Echinococcus granulosus]EUB59404.1 Endoplasmin [Echinococcus granulosus]KAH9282757.1 Endoplasmin [Echinococcus granulosus]CDS17675.1 endoplasmin [Echinococcus granulosus]